MHPNCLQNIVATPFSSVWFTRLSPQLYNMCLYLNTPIFTFIEYSLCGWKPCQVLRLHQFIKFSQKPLDRCSYYHFPFTNEGS